MHACCMHFIYVYMCVFFCYHNHCSWFMHCIYVVCYVSSFIYYYFVVIEYKYLQHDIKACCMHAICVRMYVFVYEFVQHESWSRCMHGIRMCCVCIFFYLYINICNMSIGNVACMHYVCVCFFCNINPGNMILDHDVAFHICVLCLFLFEYWYLKHDIGSCCMHTICVCVVVGFRVVLFFLI